MIATPAAALDVLRSRPLRFGDAEQIWCVNVLRLAETLLESRPQWYTRREVYAIGIDDLKNRVRWAVPLEMPWDQCRD